MYRHVHKRGWKDGSQGLSQKRLVDDDDMKGIMDQLKECGWEYSLNKLEEKKMVKDQTLPDDLRDRLQLYDEASIHMGCT